MASLPADKVIVNDDEVEELILVRSSVVMIAGLWKLYKLRAWENRRLAAIFDCPSLETCVIERAHRLLESPDSPKLKSLTLKSCWRLQRLGRMPLIERLVIHDCPLLVSLPDREEVPLLREVMITGCGVSSDGILG